MSSVNTMLNLQCKDDLFKCFMVELLEFWNVERDSKG